MEFFFHFLFMMTHQEDFPSTIAFFLASFSGESLALFIDQKLEQTVLSFFNL